MSYYIVVICRRNVFLYVLKDWFVNDCGVHTYRKTVLLIVMESMIHILFVPTKFYIFWKRPWLASWLAVCWVLWWRDWCIMHYRWSGWACVIRDQWPSPRPTRQPLSIIIRCPFFLIIYMDIAKGKRDETCTITYDAVEWIMYEYKWHSYLSTNQKNDILWIMDLFSVSSYLQKCV